MNKPGEHSVVSIQIQKMGLILLNALDFTDAHPPH